MIAIFLLVAGLGLAGWWLGRTDPEPRPSAAGLASRPVPAEGWGPMTVMTANVRLDDPKDGDNGWQNRKELLVKTLLRHMPEILGCQELSPAQGAYLKRELGAWYAYYPRAGVGTGSVPASGAAIGSDPPKGGTADVGGTTNELLGGMGEVVRDSLATMNTVFYRSDRFEILDGEAGLVLPNELQANPEENTFYTLAILRERRGEARRVNSTDEARRASAGARGGNGDAGTVIVVDVHFRHGEALAVKCAGRVKERIAAWEGRYPGSGAVVLGDMNHDKTSKLYAALTGGSASAGEPTRATAALPVALVDTFDYRKMGTGKNGTYHAFKGVATGAWPTDLIFVGSGMKVVESAEILRDKSAAGRWPTDHFLVEAGAGWQ